MFDPYCGMELNKKLSVLLGLTDKGEDVTKFELDNVSILNHFEKQGVKIDNYWKLLFKLD